MGFCCFGVLQHAIAYVEGDQYYGAKATINVWDPSIQQPNEFSLSQLWILGGSFASDLNSIEAGWQVNIYFNLKSQWVFTTNISSPFVIYFYHKNRLAQIYMVTTTHDFLPIGL